MEHFRAKRKHIQALGAKLEKFRKVEAEKRSTVTCKIFFKKIYRISFITLHIKLKIFERAFQLYAKFRQVTREI